MTNPNQEQRAQLAQEVAGLEREILNLKPTTAPETGLLAQLSAQIKALNQQQIKLGCFDASPGTGGGTTTSGTALPKYVVLSLMYAPPGSAGQGAPKSSVSYAAGSSFGVTNSAQKTFKQGVKVSVSVSVDGGVGSVGVTAGYGVTKTAATENALELVTTSTSTISVSGSSSDGINHDYDVFYVWVNPQIDLTIDGNSVSWTLSAVGTTLNVIELYAGWLRGTLPFDANVEATLKTLGFTAADYKAILAGDPFATGSTAIDPARFAEMYMTFPYEAAPAGVTPPSVQLMLKNDSTSTTTTTTSIDTEVDLSISASVQASIVKISATTSLSWTWTTTNTTKTSQETTQTATVTVTGPSAAYTGAILLAVYWDSLYGSFLFAPVTLPESDMFSGVVTGPGAKPLVHQQVVLKVAGRTLTTYTDSKGVYRYYAPPTGSAQVTVGSIVKSTMLKSGKAQLDIQVP
jgi:hypothetical protein